jgi:hypothetical protein
VRHLITGRQPAVGRHCFLQSLGWLTTGSFFELNVRRPDNEFQTQNIFAQFRFMSLVLAFAGQRQNGQH